MPKDKDDEEIKKDDGETEEPEEEVTTIKVGDEEYTQQELQQLVGLGKIGREAEEKYNVKIDGIWPRFQQTINENVQYRKEKETAKERAEREKLEKAKVEELSPEEIKKQAIIQAENLGLIHQGNINSVVQKIVVDILAAKELINNARTVVTKAAEEGKPKISEKELIEFMDKEGLKNPQTAYEIMFKDELRKIDEEKLKSIKKPEMITETGSTAGSKQPKPVKVTDDNIEKLLRERLAQEG